MKSCYTLANELQLFDKTPRRFHYTPYNWLAYTNGVNHFIEETRAQFLVEWFATFIKGFRKQHAVMPIEIDVRDDETFNFKLFSEDGKQLYSRSSSFNFPAPFTYRFVCRNGVITLPQEEL